MRIYNLNNITKEEFYKEMEIALVRQAAAQHIEIIGKEKWKNGGVIAYWFENIERDEEIITFLCIEYENGKRWRYNNIDLGLEMEIESIK